METSSVDLTIDPPENLLDREEIYLCYGDGRMNLIPVKYPDVYDAYLKQRSKFWTEDLVIRQSADDYDDFCKLTSNEQHTIKMFLAFFAASDVIVATNIDDVLIPRIKMMEAKVLYTYQEMMEHIHTIVYGKLVEIYIKDLDERAKIFDAINTIPSVKKKSGWAQKWINNDLPLGENLIAFIFVEGLQFSGIFLGISHFKKKKHGQLKGLVASNQQIMPDEGMHRNSNILLYNRYLVNKVSDERVYEILSEMMEIEEEFLHDMLGTGILGLSAGTAIQYVKFLSDIILNAIDVPPYYNIEHNPYPYMEESSLEIITSFFEREVTSYNTTSIGTKEEDCDMDSAFE